MKERIRDACDILCRKYAEQYPVLHGNLSRFTGLLIMLNVTLFFVTGAVVYEGYYYTFYSLGLLAVVEALLIIPHGLFDRLWFYALTLLVEAVALYFFTSSVWYWVSTHRSRRTRRQAPRESRNIRPRLSLSELRSNARAFAVLDCADRKIVTATLILYGKQSSQSPHKQTIIRQRPP